MVVCAGDLSPKNHLCPCSPFGRGDRLGLLGAPAVVWLAINSVERGPLVPRREGAGRSPP
eukprot:1411991-Pleurochrysis_carterae.AAC.1